MTTSTELHVVLGGTGAAGRAIVGALAHLGKSVRAVSRTDRGGWPDGVAWHGADLTKRDDLRPVLSDASVVYMAAQPAYDRWPEEFPALIEHVLSALPSPDTRLVMVDNLYPYGPVDGPIHEHLPSAATDRKGRVRAEVARRLLSAHEAGQARVAIGRAADFYGPGVEASVADLNFFRKIAAGQAVQWPARLDVPHSLTYIRDYGRALALLGTREAALGQVWHVPASEALTGRAFIELVARQANVPAKPGVLPKTAVRLAGLFNRMAREFGEMFYEFERPYVLDGSRFAAAFDFAPTPHDVAARETLAWLRAHGSGTVATPAVAGRVP
ncbi:NAD-dependent epimerase/dehydratase family protein [Deinococcus sp. Arct2-2]|uniref:NAD-dependent epimerase/dehydratase family protein n=1 Tax=Deinococcus sp. Arct2-2 TaxID=2568653 RepID=UPI0010A4BCF5|nr:NAD-dependent epimerase/dehydratase family protein [Deinococcus sp. Arct2-2]THF66725.1 NAD-dependent epimerase/dehydratase family protein [Deinococcus sp. Arct2-2]